MASIDYVDEIEVSETRVSNMIQYDIKGIIGLNWISVCLDHFKKGMGGGGGLHHSKNGQKVSRTGWHLGINVLHGCVDNLVIIFNQI